MNRLFDLYTNSAEYNNELPDMFGRARYFNSGHKNIFDPEIADIMYASGFRPHYPGNKQFAVCISHDIDHLYLKQTGKRKLLNAGKSLLKGRFGQGLEQIGSLGKDKIYDDYNLKKLVEINNRYQVRSSYYFLSLDAGDEDFNYRPMDIGEQFRVVSQSGGEIGLHGGHKAYNNIGKLQEEKLRLEQSIGKTVYGYRNHYLRFELPTTWNILEAAGFQYDTTLGYADCIGFRNGMCFPYFPFDVTGNKFLDIVELPLVIMDATLFYYMRMGPETAFKICRQLIEKVMGCGGVLTLLWHNNFLSGEMGAFYIRLLEFLQSADPWFATSAELVDWWKKEALLTKSHKLVAELIKN